MGVLVLLEMDGSTEAVLAAAVDLEARRPTSAKLARVVAPTESGVVVADVLGIRRGARRLPVRAGAPRGAAGERPARLGDGDAIPRLRDAELKLA